MPYLLVKKNLNVYQQIENNIRVLVAARRFGLTLVNIGPEDLTTGSGEKKYLVLGLAWQLVAMDIRRRVSSIVAHSDPTLLLRGGEDKDAFSRMVPEAILLRWFNFHLENAKHDRRVANLTEDIRDSVNYAVLLSQLEPSRCSRDSVSAEQDLFKRAELMLQQAAKIGCRKFLRPQDVVYPVERLNFAFVALLFSKYPSMPSTDPVPAPESAKAPEPEPEPAQDAEPEKQEPEKQPEIDLEEAQKRLDSLLEEKDRLEDDYYGVVDEKKRADREEWKRLMELKDKMLDQKVATKEQAEARERLARVTEEIGKVKSEIIRQHEEKKVQLMKKLKHEQEKAKKRLQYVDWTPTELQWAIDLAARERASLERQAASLSGVKDEEMAALDELSELNAELQGRLERIKAETAATAHRMTKKEARMDSRVKEAQEGAEEKKVLFETVTQGIQDAESQKLHLDQEKRKLDVKLGDVQAQRSAGQDLLARLEQEISEQQAAADKARMEHIHASKQIAVTTRRIAKITAETVVVKKEANVVRQERERLEDRSEQVLDDITAQQTETQVARTEFELADAAVDEAQEELEDAVIDSEHDIQRAGRDARQEIEARRRATEVARKHEELKTAQLADEAMAAQAEVVAEQARKQEAARAAHEGEEMLRQLKDESRAVRAAKETVEALIEDHAEAIAEAQAQTAEAEARERTIRAEDSTVHRLAEKARKEADAVAEQTAVAEQVVKATSLEAERLTEAAAEESRLANRLKLKQQDAKLDARRTQAALEDAEDAKSERLEEIAKEKEAAEARRKKEHQHKIAKKQERAKTVAGEKAELEKALKATETTAEESERAKEEAAKLKRVNEARLEEETKSAAAAAARIDGLDSALRDAQSLVDQKKQKRDEEEERRRQAELRARAAERKLAAATAERAAADSERRRRDELERLISLAASTTESLTVKSRRELADVASSVEEGKAARREEAAKERAKKLELKREERRREEERLKRDAEEEKQKAQRRLRAIQAETSRIEADLAAETAERQRLERAAATTVKAKPVGK